MQNQKESLNFLTRNWERGFRKFDSKTEAGGEGNEPPTSRASVNGRRNMRYCKKDKRY